MKKTIVFIFLVFLILLNKKIVSAQAKILINEFLIEPQPQQVEIINIGSESADLKDWIIDDDGGSSSIYKIENNTIIYPNSCIVFSENFYLNTKSADTIRLFDKNNNLIDSYSYKLSPGQNISFQRIPDGEINWSTESANIGFFNLTKTACIITPTLTPTPLPTLSPTPTLTPTSTIIPTITIISTPTPTNEPISYNNIFISEAMINPLTGEKEWIEFFNNNDFSVYLTNWYIDDIEGGGAAPKIFSLEIPPKSYKAIILSTAIFNNSGDYVRLLDFNKNLKDSFEYQSSTQNKTWGRVDFENDNFCLQEPSFEKPNNFCIQDNNQVTSLIQKPTNTLSPALTTLTKPNKKINQTKTETKNYNNQISIIKKIKYKNNSQPEVLGINTNNTNKANDKKNLIYFFSFNSILYTFLTETLILIKIKLKYGKVKKFILSLIYSQ